MATNSPAKTTTVVIPVYNASVKVARDERDQIIGVTICCLHTHDQISELPTTFMESAHNVLDEAVKQKWRIVQTKEKLRCHLACVT